MCRLIFIDKVARLDSLDELSIRKRCRLVYFLLSTYVDWRDTKFSRVKIKNSFTTIMFENIHKDGPVIEIDFQSIVDTLLTFSPSSDHASNWWEVFARGLTNPLPLEEVTSEIVFGGGAKKKPGRKRKL